MNVRPRVVIVGGGPVGLLLGCCLHHFGISFAILEQRTAGSSGSRAIGIHPPGLRIMEKVGLAEKLIAKGVRVQSGKAFCGSRLLGDISFAHLPVPFNFVLSVPQNETEKLLEDHLEAVAPGCLRRGVKWEKMDDADGDFVAACDGWNSAVREALGIAFDGAAYADTFVMGDFPDETGWGPEARIFLDDAGFIESFPLPAKIRRWVLHGATENAFVEEIRARTGSRLTTSPVETLSTFRIHRRLAATFAKDNILLAGDAAHVMSPIGGQGMNVGWMDAWDAAETLAKVTGGFPMESASAAYNEKARARAMKAMARSERYMAIGRGGRMSFLKRAALQFVLRSPARKFAANYFAMHGL